MSVTVMRRLPHTPRVLRMLSPISPIQYRMCSTSLRYPDQIFSTVPPSPPPWPKRVVSPSSSQTCATSPSLSWKEAKNEDNLNKRLAFVLLVLQRTLRSVHKRKVDWPTEESIPSNLPPSEYLMVLLQPIAGLFNQLRSPGVLKSPLECIRVTFGQSIHGMTFTAGFKTRGLTAPIILSLPDNLFDFEGKVSSRVEYALSKALELECKPSPPSIIVTNFKDLAVFFPPAWNRPEHVFERVATSQPSLALRVISAAYLLNALPYHFINTPSPNIEVDEDLVLPEGPPQDPNQNLPDERVFATRHRHSDFDFVTLVRDRARALQFFRWREHVQQQCSKLVAHPNDILTAVTNEVGFIIPDVHPIYPFDASEIPIDTATHLKMIQRESPLVTAEIAEPFKRSKTFTLKIQNVVAKGSEHGICTVYRCQITSIDDNPVSSPSLCLKLFDDRFQPLRSPNEDDEEPDELLPRWFDSVLIAELYAVNEAFAYDKLRPAQGSVIPWFYGTHQFTLPDGTVLYGLLLEYVDGWGLNSNFTRELSSDRQITMIQSCRHATRVLDVADVSQRDWHAGQILLYTNPTTKLDHAVLIDFASTTQTWELDEPNFIDNYFGVLRVLLGNEGDVGFDGNVVWKHFGEPDDWDALFATFSCRQWNNVPNQELRLVKNRDLFPYISPA